MNEAAKTICKLRTRIDISLLKVIEQAKRMANRKQKKVVVFIGLRIINMILSLEPNTTEFSKDDLFQLIASSNTHIAFLASTALLKICTEDMLETCFESYLACMSKVTDDTLCTEHLRSTLYIIKRHPAFTGYYINLVMKYRNFWGNEAYYAGMADILPDLMKVSWLNRDYIMTFALDLVYKCDKDRVQSQVCLEYNLLDPRFSDTRDSTQRKLETVSFHDLSFGGIEKRKQLREHCECAG